MQVAAYRGVGSTSYMRIGELAKKAGVTIQTLRFYEREDVLPEPKRAPSGYRHYDERDLAHIVFVRECQQLGFSLREIKELAGIHDSLDKIRKNTERPPKEFQRVLTIASERLRAIDQKIEALEQMQQCLRRLLSEAEMVLAGKCPASLLKTQK